MSKKSKVKVAAIQIQYADGTGKQLSIEDARELFEQLSGLFGEKTIVMPASPVIIERDLYPWRPHWHVTNEPLKFPTIDGPAPKVWCCEGTALNAGT